MPVQRHSFIAIAAPCSINQKVTPADYVYHHDLPSHGIFYIFTTSTKITETLNTIIPESKKQSTLTILLLIKKVHRHEHNEKSVDCCWFN